MSRKVSEVKHNQSTFDQAAVETANVKPFSVIELRKQQQQYDAEALQMTLDAAKALCEQLNTVLLYAGRSNISTEHKIAAIKRIRPLQVLLQNSLLQLGHKTVLADLGDAAEDQYSLLPSGKQPFWKQKRELVQR